MSYFFPPKKSEKPDLSLFEEGITRDAPLGEKSWFRCGGCADMLYTPQDVAALSEFLKIWPVDEPLTIAGGLANTIVRDGGVRGVTVKLGKTFSSIAVMADKKHIRAGCGALNGSVAAAAVKAGIGGLEFLSGIPGTLGGAVAMNAGAYGTEMKDVLIGVEVITRQGTLKKLTADALQFSYRHAYIPEGSIVVSVLLRGQAEDYNTVKDRMTEIKQRRNDTQPIKEYTGGSTFANPGAEELRRCGLPEDMRAWQVVERVGGRGLQIGGAKMSEKHCNFMVNTGNASASDLENLGDELIRRAYDEFGLRLRWEIKRIGECEAQA